MVRFALLRTGLVVRFGWVAGGLLMAAPGALHAQTSSCYLNNPAVPAAGSTCYNNGAPPLPPPPPPEPYTIPTNVTCTPVEQLLGTCRYKSVLGDLRQSRERREVAKLIAAGQCDTAMKRALSENDLDTAEHVRSLCVPPTAPAANYSAPHEDVLACERNHPVMDCLRGGAPPGGSP